MAGLSLTNEPNAVSVIVELTQSMMNTGSAEEVVKVIQEAVISCYQAGGCSIGLIEEQTGWLVFVAMEGQSKTEEFRIPPGRGIAGWVVEHRKGVLSNNVYEDPRFFKTIDRQTGFVTQSLMCVPLTVNGEIIGVIQALNTSKGGGFTQEDLDLFAILGQLTGTSISRTRKFGVLRSIGAALQEESESRHALVGGSSHAMQQVLQVAKTVASSNTTVLLMSESGTGKEVMARSIHRWSRREFHPFIAVNCVALTSDLLASELFGHEKGAFTGAISQKKGKFESADGGTIFLDEIGDLSLDLQAKILRVIQDREFQRVGGNRDIRSDVRIIAATNRDLKRAMAEGLFREDLYYRLNVITIALPPLRERKADLKELVSFFVSRFSREMSRPTVSVSDKVMQVLHEYSWPGNVRELQNVMERAVVLTPGSEITMESLPHDIVAPYLGEVPPVASVPGTAGYKVGAELALSEAVEVFKRERIREALSKTHGNQAQAAVLLGLQPSNLSRLLKKMSLN